MDHLNFFTLFVSVPIRTHSTLICRIVSKMFLDSVTICVTALEPHVWWISAPSVVGIASTRALALALALALAQTRRLWTALVACFHLRLLWTAPALTFQSTHSGQLLYSSVHQIKHTQSAMIWSWPLTSSIDYSDCRQFAASVTR